MSKSSPPPPERLPASGVAGTEAERLRLATEIADIGLWDIDLSTRAHDCTPRVKAMFGLPAAAPMTLDDFHAALHPDDHAAVAAALDAACDPARRSLYAMEFRAIGLKDGRVRWVAAKGRGLFDDAGRCARVIGTAIDITAQKVAEAHLKSSEDRLRLLDRIGLATRELIDANAVMATTARLLGEHLGATRCAYADVEADNDRFTIRSDWSADGVPSSVGVYSLDLFGPQATSNLRNGRALVVNDVDAELGDDGGGRMFNAIGIKAIICAGLVKHGRLVAMMAVHHARPRRWSDDELAIVTEVVDRCWAHIERVRDNALLREQDRRKDEFLATLAHELRNPLAPMKYAIAIQRSTTDPARLARAQDVLARQTSHLARLVDDLLDVSRINRGLIQLQRETVALAPLMRQAVEAVHPAMEAARHRFHTQLPDDTLRIDADPVRIVQVVGNLLTNAVKYTPDGGDIRLAAWRSGRHAVIEVVDNGIGIPKELQGRVFQMFSQLNHARGRSNGGLGIGLSLVKRLVEMHGGRVEVHSDGLDEGTRFQVELPLHAEAPAGPPAQPVAPAALVTGSARPRVLVVEDNVDGRTSLVALLETHGYPVDSAPDGPEALLRAARFAPHIVLLDLGLPGMDGYAVAARLRADTALVQPVIVALTGWGAESDRRRTQASGFDGHLTKPVEPDELLQMLSTWPVHDLAS